MNFLHSWHPQSIALDLGGFTIHWYGMMLALGALAAYWLIRKLARHHGVAEHQVSDLFVLLIVTGFLGARLYHVLNELPYYLNQPSQIFAVWNGGLAIHGGILAGSLILWWYAKRHQLNWLAMADLLVPGMALGQAIGRWGNYFNQELFGRPTGLPWGIPIDLEHRPIAYQTAGYFHPTFLYESLANLFVTVLLVWLVRKRLPAGTALAIYAISYALIRIGMETLRTDKTPIIMGIRLPILVSLAMLVAASAFLIRRLSRPNGHHA